LAAAEEKRKFVFEPLASAHHRAAFSCGQEVLDHYLKTQARQDVSKKLAAVYVMTIDGKTIAGFYTLSQYVIQSAEIPEEIRNKLTRHDEIPATLIGRLARDKVHSEKGDGALLVVDALKRCLTASINVASWAVIVDAKDDQTAEFYKKFGFTVFPSRPLKLFLPTVTIQKMFA
jgi:hypothetical protein